MGRSDDENDGRDRKSSRSTRRVNHKNKSSSSAKNSSSSSRKKKSDRKKKRSRQYHDESSYSSSASSEDDDSYNDNNKRRKNKKERKREKKHKKDKRKRHRRSDDDDSSLSEDESTSSKKQTAGTPLDERNVLLADALVSLLEEHPALVEDLPIMLIRLAGGTSFDLSQMTNASASRGIAAVFACLEPFGVHQEAATNGAWMWKKPEGISSSSNNQQKTTSSELILIRLVRAMLDQVGLSMEAIRDFEQPTRSRGKKVAATAAAAAANTVASKQQQQQQHRHNSIQKQVKVLVNQFQQGETSLAKELAGLCNMILEGESVALDGLPDERLRGALESLFTDCGLEKSEMEEEEEEDDDDSEEDEENDNEANNNCSPTFGYGVPEGKSSDDVRSYLMTVLETCKTVSVGGDGGSSKQRAVKGPMPMPASYTAPTDYAETDSDDEGPLLPGADKRGPSQSKEMVKARAARRSLELESVKQGHGLPATTGRHGEVREEWMLVPGKFDLLSAVKSGQSMKSRNFQAQSKAGGDANKNEPVDAAIQAEISAIRQAHEQSRGPSLLEQHRQKKETEAKAASNKNDAWKWDRDKDLDAGRKVDKNALKMLFGSAGTDLKSKFHS